MNHECKYEDKIEQMSGQIGDIHDALLGSLKNPNGGALNRISKLESWKKSVVSGVKSKFTWVYAVLGATVVGIIIAFIEPIAKKLME